MVCSRIVSWLMPFLVQNFDTIEPADQPGSFGPCSPDHWDTYAVIDGWFVIEIFPMILTYLRVEVGSSIYLDRIGHFPGDRQIDQKRNVPVMIPTKTQHTLVLPWWQHLIFLKSKVDHNEPLSDLGHVRGEPNHEQLQFPKWGYHRGRKKGLFLRTENHPFLVVDSLEPHPLPSMMYHPLFQSMRPSGYNQGS